MLQVLLRNLRSLDLEIRDLRIEDPSLKSQKSNCLSSRFQNSQPVKNIPVSEFKNLSDPDLFKEKVSPECQVECFLSLSEKTACIHPFAKMPNMSFYANIVGLSSCSHLPCGCQLYKVTSIWRYTFLYILEVACV